MQNTFFQENLKKIDFSKSRCRPRETQGPHDVGGADRPDRRAGPWGPKGSQGPRDQYKQFLEKMIFEIFLMLDHCFVINAILTL